jgi:hypothetical protein
MAATYAIGMLALMLGILVLAIIVGARSSNLLASVVYATLASGAAFLAVRTLAEVLGLATAGLDGAATTPGERIETALLSIATAAFYYGAVGALIGAGWRWLRSARKERRAA